MVNDKQHKQHNVKMPSGTISEISRKWARRREEVETTGLGERDNGDGDWDGDGEWRRGMGTRECLDENKKRGVGRLWVDYDVGCLWDCGSMGGLRVEV